MLNPSFSTDNWYSSYSIRIHIHLQHKIAPVADCAIDTAEEIFGFFIII